MKKQIQILVVRPGENPVVETIPNTLVAKQKLVEGDVEFVNLFENPSIVLVCNETGKLDGLPVNRTVRTAYMVDVICGNFFLAQEDEEGDLCSLDISLIEKYNEVFSVEEGNNE